MDKVLLLKIVISFIVAGVWIGGATLIAESLGSKKGGLITNLPATILISLVFVAFVQDARFAARATGKIIIISSTNIIVYALAVSLTYPALGIVFGTIVSFGLASIWVLLLHPLIQKLSK